MWHRQKGASGCHQGVLGHDVPEGVREKIVTREGAGPKASL